MVSRSSALFQCHRRSETRALPPRVVSIHPSHCPNGTRRHRRADRPGLGPSSMPASGPGAGRSISHRAGGEVPGQDAVLQQLPAGRAHALTPQHALSLGSRRSPQRELCEQRRKQR
ncbi:hypothetical protein evm_004551 [Chilo suppressalis]|nr:hypothetical protein evm_004551 [Chilo suppressalis]